MSDHTDTSPADPSATDDAAAPDECERPWCGAGPLSANLTTRPTMPVGWLTAHPGNVRADLDLSAEFVASIAENGVLVPLRITIDGDGDTERYRVIDGHRRLGAAVQAGLGEVPYDLAPDRCGDEAGQFLDMFNAHRHRKGFTRLEEADALFSASTAGATRTRIRKSTGLKAGQVKAALSAATLTEDTRASAGELGRERGDELTLEDLAILAEFQDEPEALNRLMNSAAYHDSLEHEAERLRQEHADRAQHERLIGELTASGLTITDSLPPGALRLPFLTHEGEQLTPESHATCPGRGAFFYTWDLDNPVHYCTDPTQYGHQQPEDIPSSPSALGSAGSSGSPTPAPDAAAPPAEDAEVAASRRRVIEGNRAWRAAAEVRHRWLAGQLFARRSAPREVDVFVAAQLLTMPEVPRRYLSSAGMSSAFAATTGQQSSQMIEACATAASRKLPPADARADRRCLRARAHDGCGRPGHLAGQPVQPVPVRRCRRLLHLPRFDRLPAFVDRAGGGRRQHLGAGSHPRSGLRRRDHRAGRHRGRGHRRGRPARRPSGHGGQPGRPSHVRHRHQREAGSSLTYQQVRRAAVHVTAAPLFPALPRKDTEPWNGLKKNSRTPPRRYSTGPATSSPIRRSSTT